MKKCSFRFYGPLNDFLPADRKHVDFVHEFELSSSLKDVIEALGVPHTEIDLVLVNGTPSALSRMVHDDDRASVYPWFCSVQPEIGQRLRPMSAREARFICDTHLGRLTAYLRMLGFDTLYCNDCEDDELAHISADEQRILLTRDRGLLKRSSVVQGYFVRSSDSRQQLRETIERFDLQSCISAFTRCMHCNTLVQQVRKEQVLDRLPPRTRELHNDFRLCPGCQKVYWKGSHFFRMQRLIEAL
jgi:uncharacterized protein with PIN domain